MKRLLVLLLVTTAVFSQPMIFELKDYPTSITYHEDGSSEVFTTNFFYDGNKRLTKVENGLEFADLTASYSKNGDTTIITIDYEAFPEFETEFKTEIIKQLHDNQGKVIKEISFTDQKIEGECSYFYNQAGDLIKEICKSEYSDTTYYEWDITALRVKVSTRGVTGEGTVVSYAEYTIDADKKILKAEYFDCEDQCEESGNFAMFNYTTSVIKPACKKMSVEKRSGKTKIYSINGRVMVAKYTTVNSVFIGRQEGKLVTQLQLKK